MYYSVLQGYRWRLPAAGGQSSYSVHHESVTICQGFWGRGKAPKEDSRRPGVNGLLTSQLAHRARAYPGFGSMKRLGVFLLPPGWDASPSQDYPPALSSLLPIYTPGWREALWKLSGPDRVSTLLWSCFRIRCVIISSANMVELQGWHRLVRVLGSHHCGLSWKFRSGVITGLS